MQRLCWESFETSSSICHWVEAAHQLSENSVAVDTSTRVSAIARSSRWWKSNQRELLSSNTWATMPMSDSLSVNITTKCFRKYKTMLVCLNMSLSREHHRRKRETWSFKLSSNLTFKWFMLFDRYCQTTPSKKSKRRIDKSIDFFKTGQTQPTMKCGGFRISWRRKQRHNVFCASSSTKRSQHLQSYLMITSSVKPCLLYLQLHVTGPPFIDALPRGRFNKYVSDWMKSMSDGSNDNVTWIDYRHCSKRELSRIH